VLDEPHAAELVAEPSVQLLRALIAHHVTDHETTKGALDASLSLRIQQHIQSHSPGLGLQVIAVEACSSSGSSRPSCRRDRCV